MDYTRTLEITSHWAAILTAVVAVVAYFHFVGARIIKRRRLESYLKAEKDRGEDRGQRTVLHLAANLCMTESEIVDAAFRSAHVDPVVAVDSQGRASVLMLEYKP